MKFKILKSGAQYYFNIVASNGQVLATSERYYNKADAVSAANSIKRNAAAAPIDDTTAAATSYRW